jgi:hypothetical protein
LLRGGQVSFLAKPIDTELLREIHGQGIDMALRSEACMGATNTQPRRAG